MQLVHFSVQQIQCITNLLRIFTMFQTIDKVPINKLQTTFCKEIAEGPKTLPRFYNQTVHHLVNDLKSVTLIRRTLM